MATIKDVAKLAGVSTSTVSRALSGRVPVDERTRQRVLRCVRDLHYRPNMLAQGLKDGRTRTLGFFIPNIENQIYPSLAIAVETAARERGYFVLFCNTQDDQEREKDYVEQLQNRFVDGFLFSTALAGRMSRSILSLRDRNYPVVCLMRGLDDGLDAFISDNETGAYLGTQYLIDRGFRRIATITGRSHVSLYAQRMAGYQRAMAEAGLPVDDDLVWKGVSGNRETADECVLEQLCAGHRPEAIFAQSDPLAIQAIKAICASGLRVPEDISVVGYDNSPYAAQYIPALTTVEQPLHEMGRQATLRLIDIIEGVVAPRNPACIFPARVIERASVIPANHPASPVRASPGRPSGGDMP